MAQEKFFFYGSLTNGLVHFEKIKNFVQDQRPAQVRGSVYRLQVGYPVAVQGGHDVIQGTLMTLCDSDMLVQLLDQFHGVDFFDEKKSMHIRKQVEVVTPAGPEIAWVYFLNPEKLPKTAKIIVDGDWQKSLSENPPLTTKLNEKQRHYLGKLSAITGREILPINDLTLYRELMKLELIVDKGRRIALSKLGHEVCRYLV
jgi:gamma-glutamylcyclotransferase (GGCT)/AIG2-like uncharacterized protein YtfP